jgi:TRAP transporter TAXI family solute receptor
MTVRIGTNEVGGTFHAQGTAIAELLQGDSEIDDIEILASRSASVANANHLDRDDLDFGFMASNWIGRAHKGTPPFDHPIRLRMASPVNAGPMFFVSRAESAVKTIDDLRGRRIAIGVEGGGMTQHVHTIFDVLGISFDDFTPVYIGFSEGAAALTAGEVDVQWQCPIPNRVMTDLADGTDVRVVEYAPDQLDKLLAEVPFYRPAVMAAGAFRGLDRDSAQVGVLNVLATHERVDENMVCRVVKAMVENTGALSRLCPLYGTLAPLFEPLRSEGAAALKIGGVELHPGAVRAYRETGYLT